MVEAEITLEYDNPKIGQVIAEAVSPDNLRLVSSLTIKTTIQNNKVSTSINCKKGLPTMIATIDDLLFCVSIAERTMRTVKRLE